MTSPGAYALVPLALDAAAALIEKGWCQGHSARDHTGRVVNPNSDKAVGWCAAGAIARAVSPMHSPAIAESGVHPGIVDTAARGALRRLLGSDICFWNDAPERTSPEVIAALRTAAEGVRNALLLATALPIGKET